MKFALLAVACATLLSPSAASAARFTYAVTEIGRPAGAGYVQATAFNDLGTVIGSAYVAGVEHGFVWTASSGTTLLDTPAGSVGLRLSAINASGQIAATVLHEDRVDAVRREADGSLTDLGSLDPGYPVDHATGLNDAGDVVGLGYAGDARAWRWTGAGGMASLGTLGGNYSEARGINATGQVVGYSLTGSTTRAFRWDEAGGMIDLGSLAGARGRSEAWAINADGKVVGSTGSADGNVAFLWTEATGMTAIGGRGTVATGINAAGLIVGYGGGELDAYGFLVAGGGLVKLDDLIDPDSGWRITGASAVNSFGHILASGERNGRFANLLLTVAPAAAVPEPAAWASLALGFGLAGLALRRRPSRVSAL